MSDTNTPPLCPEDQEPLSWFLWTRLFDLPPAERERLARDVLTKAFAPEAWTQPKELQ